MPSKVDLPEPLRPTRQIRSPAATARPAPDNSGAAPKVSSMSCSRSNGGTSQPLPLWLEPKPSRARVAALAASQAGGGTGRRDRPQSCTRTEFLLVALDPEI